MAKHHTPNDHRSIAKNPNNPARAADIANRVAQGHAKAPPPPPPPAAPQQTQSGTQGGKK